MRLRRLSDSSSSLPTIFGLFKRLDRKSAVDTMSDIERVVKESSPSGKNVAQRLSRIRDIQLLHPLIDNSVDRSCFIAASAIESFKQIKYMTRISLGYPSWHGEGGKDGPGSEEVGSVVSSVM